MLWIALAVTAAAPQSAAEKAPARLQAYATVRIIQSATIRLGDAASGWLGMELRATETRFRDADGTMRPARIVEFP